MEIIIGRDSLHIFSLGNSYQLRLLNNLVLLVLIIKINMGIVFRDIVLRT